MPQAHSSRLSPLSLTVAAVVQVSRLNAGTNSLGTSMELYVIAAAVIGGVALSIFLLSAGDLLVAGPKWDSSQAKSLMTLNQMIAGVLVLGCIVVGLAFLRKFIRIVRRWSSDTHTPDLAS